MNDSCLRCTTALSASGIAYICSHECTFCAECTRRLAGVCPNCSGELVRRPRRREQAAPTAAPARLAGRGASTDAS